MSRATFRVVVAAVPATQKDVAALAGVARTTVGYVLSGRRRGGRISQAVCDRVRAAARQIDYVPNRRAQALVSGKTRIVGLLIESAHEDLWVWSRIAQGAQEALLKAGYDALIHGMTRDLPPYRQAETLIRQGRVDGVIAIPFAKRETGVPQKPAKSIPLVWVDLGTDQPCPRVLHDPRPGLAQAVEHLARLGHRHALWITPEVALPDPLFDRTAAVAAAALAAKLSLRTLTLPLPDRRLNDEQPALLDVLRKRLKPARGLTAILCWNDCLALSVCAVLRDRGLRVPDDISVVGFDDIRPMYHVPSLSTVSGAFAEMGVAAAGLALKQIAEQAGDRGAPRTSLAVPTFFIPRGSTAAPRAI